MDKSIKLSEQLHGKVKSLAREEKRTFKAILELSIVNYLQKRTLEK